MSEEQKGWQYIGTLLILLTVIFTVVELLFWFDVIPPTDDLEGFFVNLGYSLDRWFDNPALMGWIATIIVALGGYLENYVMTGEGFQKERFAETFFYYEPLLILFSQAIPTKYALVFLFAIDVARRIATRFKKPG